MLQSITKMNDSDGELIHSLVVDVQNSLDDDIGESNLGLPPEQQIVDWANQAHNFIHDQASDLPIELAIRIVGAEEMQQLNLQFRGFDKVTNVLSFPMRLDESIAQEYGAQQLGDIVICHAVVEQEAASQDKSLEAHYAHMVVHGVLHLEGYDHHTDAEAQIMESAETAILIHCGFENPYS